MRLYTKPLPALGEAKDFRVPTPHLDARSRQKAVDKRQRAPRASPDEVGIGSERVAVTSDEWRVTSEPPPTSDFQEQ
jgi:hypothetical protein